MAKKIKLKGVEEILKGQKEISKSMSSALNALQDFAQANSERKKEARSTVYKWFEIKRRKVLAQNGVAAKHWTAMKLAEDTRKCIAQLEINGDTMQSELLTEVLNRQIYPLLADLAQARQFEHQDKHSPATKVDVGAPDTIAQPAPYKKVNSLANEKQIKAYFAALTQDNPKNDRPFVKAKDLDRLLGNIFENIGLVGYVEVDTNFITGQIRMLLNFFLEFHDYFDGDRNLKNAYAEAIRNNFSLLMSKTPKEVSDIFIPSEKPSSKNKIRTVELPSLKSL